ncbi:MAG TPA: PA0069 family radical SAM protein [Chthoniobacterales bacterium]|jgi:DNA repair photolyase
MATDGHPPGARARGAAANPKNRFEKLEYVDDPDAELSPDDEPRPLQTQFLKDATQSIITYNNSPDLGFDASLNPYRGCEHGCAYCFARPTHEFLGYSAGLDFETKIVVKENAPELLRAELSSRKWKPQVLVMSGVTDCYQPVERRLEVTRRCLAVMEEFRQPVAIITKNHLVTRDIDHLSILAAENAVVVNISITTLDAELGKTLEPRASSPSRRLAAVEELSAAGIPVRVLMAPCIPGLTDHELPAVFAAAAKAGAQYAGYVPLRLPGAVAPIFSEWLERVVPGQKEKILSRVRSLRGGKLNDPRFGSRLRGEGIFAEEMNQLARIARHKTGLKEEFPDLSTASFRVPTDQLTLF